MLKLRVCTNCHCVPVKLELLVSDIKIQTKYALGEAYKLVKRNCVGFIGTWTSGTTIEVSKLLSIPLIDRAIISYAASSPQMSEPDFSNVLRTKESDEVVTTLMAKMMRGSSARVRLVWGALWGE